MYFGMYYLKRYFSKHTCIRILNAATSYLPFEQYKFIDRSLIKWLLAINGRIEYMASETLQNAALTEATEVTARFHPKQVTRAAEMRLC